LRDERILSLVNIRFRRK